MKSQYPRKRLDGGMLIEPAHVIASMTNPDALAIYVHSASMEDLHAMTPRYIKEQFGIGGTRYASAIRYLKKIGLVFRGDEEDMDGTTTKENFIARSSER